MVDDGGGAVGFRRGLLNSTPAKRRTAPSHRPGNGVATGPFRLDVGRWSVVEATSRPPFVTPAAAGDISGSSVGDEGAVVDLGVRVEVAGRIRRRYRAVTRNFEMAKAPKEMMTA